MTDSIGCCKTCKWHGPRSNPREVQALCTNPKLCEAGEPEADKPDSLTYCYSEGGSFTTGDDFGCVHHEPMPT